MRIYYSFLHLKFNKILPSENISNQINLHQNTKMTRYDEIIREEDIQRNNKLQQITDNLHRINVNRIHQKRDNFRVSFINNNNNNNNKNNNNNNNKNKIYIEIVFIYLSANSRGLIDIRDINYPLNLLQTFKQCLCQ